MSGILNVLLAGNSAAAPAAPSGISGAAYTSGSVTFNYTAGSDSGLPITNYRAVSGGINYAVTYTSSVITVSGLTNGTTYDFYLQAFNSSGWGALSTTHTGSITPYAGTLTAPSITSWTSNATDTTFNWGTVTSATSYQIDFQNAGTFALNTASLTTNYASTAASVVIKIYAIATGWINSSTTTYTATYTTPGTPTSVAAALVATSGTLSVSFTPSTTIGGGSTATSGLIKQYNVYVNGGLSVSYTGSSSPISCGSLTVGTSYTFQITQVNYANLESAKSTASTGVAAPGVPAAPTIGTATATGTQTATLAFTANATNGYPITSYQAFTSGGTSVNIVSSTASSLSLNGLTQGTSYQFYMKVVNAIGTSAQSGTSTPAITTWTTPSAPTMGTVTVSGTTITIPWTAPASTGGTPIDFYYLYTGATLISSTIASSAVSYSYTGVKNTAYTFTIYAHNSVGLSAVSATSNSVTATGVPDAPSLTSATFSGTTVYAYFSAPTNTGGLPIDVYRIDNNGSPLTTTQATSPYTFTGSYGTTYTLTVYAHNSAGWSTVSNSGSTTPYTTPGTASSLSFTQTGLNTGNLSFTNPVSNGATIDYYYVYIGGSYSQQVNGAGSPLALTGISNGSIITIYAHNAAGLGGVSTSTTASMVAIPSTLSISSSGVTSSGATISFTQTGGAPTSWIIYNWPTFNSYTGGSQLYNGSSIPSVALSLSASTTYNLSAYGLNVAGQSTNWSTMIQVITPAASSIPGAPTITNGGYTSATGYIYFTAGSAGNLTITAYQAYDSNSATYFNATGTTSPVTVSLTNGTTYRMYLRAFNSLGWGPLSSGYVDITPYAGTLTAPAISSWTSNATSIYWTWPAVTSATSYQMDFQNAGTFATNTVSPPSPGFGPIAQNAVFKVYAKAAGWINSSVSTSTATFTTPGAPTVGTLTVDGTATVTLPVTPSANIGGGSTTAAGVIKQYNIYMNGSASLSWTTTTLPWTHAMSANTSYYFQVTQVNYADLESAKSAVSNTITTPTWPSAPPGLYYSVTTAGVVTLGWGTTTNGGSNILDYTTYLNGTGYSVVANPPANISATAGAAVSVGVSARNGIGSGPTSTLTNIAVLVAPVITTSLSGTTLTVSMASTGASGYTWGMFTAGYGTPNTDGSPGISQFTITVPTTTTTYYISAWARTGTAGVVSAIGYKTSTITVTSNTLNWSTGTGSVTVVPGSTVTLLMYGATGGGGGRDTAKGGDGGASSYLSGTFTVPASQTSIAYSIGNGGGAGQGGISWALSNSGGDGGTGDAAGGTGGDCRASGTSGTGGGGGGSSRAWFTPSGTTICIAGGSGGGGGGSGTRAGTIGGSVPATLGSATTSTAGNPGYSIRNTGSVAGDGGGGGGGGSGATGGVGGAQGSDASAAAGGGGAGLNYVGTGMAVSTLAYATGGAGGATGTAAGTFATAGGAGAIRITYPSYTLS